MTTLVYQFRLDAPLSGEREAREQMAAAHRYTNDLVAIERGRRDALRALHDTPAVREAEAVLRDATRSTRRAAVKTLWAARREADRQASAVDESLPEIGSALAAIEALPKDASTKARSTLRRRLREARAAAGDELARIQILDESIRVDARHLATCHWGTYLSVEASADQMRKAALYGTDALTPASPRFRRGGHRDYLDADDARSAWWCAPSQVGMHVQGRICRTRDVLEARDPWARLEDAEPIVREEPGHQHTRRAVLALRIEAGTWARWPVRMHREIPDAARWSWVRVSCRPQRGAADREQWSVEITVDDPAPRPRELAAESLAGAIAVELLWSPLDDGSMRVARWLDSRGERGEVLLPPRLVRGLGAVPSGIRSVRDTLRTAAKDRIVRALRESDHSWAAREIAEIDYARAKPASARSRRQSRRPAGATSVPVLAARGDIPAWLAQATGSLHLWESPNRLVDLARRWRAARCDAARTAYELLDAWEERDRHLDDYEDGARARSLRWRRETYRVLAAGWSQRYATVLVPDRDLSREARWGEESEQRFLASPQELRDCLRHAFGDGAQEIAWRGPHGVLEEGGEEDEDPSWLEMAIERWCAGEIAVSARASAKGSEIAHVRGGAWARRHAAAQDRDAERATARKAAGKGAE